MWRPDLKAYLAVISHHRSQNAQPMQEIVGPATWFVGSEEADAYLDAGAQCVVPSGGLCESRNAALRMAWEAGLPCVQASDDLKKLQLATPEGAKPLAFVDVVQKMRDELRESRFFRMVGVSPTDNIFYYNPKSPVNYQAFIVGDLILVEPCELFFDEDMRLKEDYDYTLQHVAIYGGVVRCNDILASFAHRTNRGGAVDYRSKSLEAETIAYLKDKWGNCVRDNPRRSNEILLRFPKQKMAKRT